MYIGENNLPTASPATNNVCAKDGVIFARINTGTNIGAIIFHLVSVKGISIDINIIAINTTNNNGTPPKFKLPIKSTTLVAITPPIFDHSSNPIIIDAQGSECFVSVGNGYSWWNISSNSDYHFKEEYKQYESQIGIYAGSGFSDKQLAPVPFIVDHRVDSETDASGKLNIHIRVKASE